jgi:hypothetical protein
MRSGGHARKLKYEVDRKNELSSRAKRRICIFASLRIDDEGFVMLQRIPCVLLRPCD